MSQNGVIQNIKMKPVKKLKLKNVWVKQLAPVEKGQEYWLESVEMCYKVSSRFQYQDLVQQIVKDPDPEGISQSRELDRSISKV